MENNNSDLKQQKSEYVTSKDQKKTFFQRQQKVKLPMIDPNAINELEKEATLVASDFYKLTNSLQESLNAITAATVCSSQMYRDSIDKNCESVDNCIDEHQILIARAKDLSRTMEPIYILQKKVLDIKTVLGSFESQI
jgi:BLOC-1 related complex subunit 6